MHIEMDNQRAIDIIKQIPIVAKSYRDGEPLNDLSEALIKAVMALEKNH